MNGYLDLQREAEAALERRRRHRRRLISGIRGWLRQKHHPRWLAFGLFLACVPVGAVVSYAVSLWGVEAWGAAPAIGVFAMWPVYVFLSGKVCARIARGDEYLAEFGMNATFDETEEARENEELFRGKELDDETQRGISGGLQQGGGGGAALPAAILLVCITVGTWLIWLMVRGSPTLYAEAILDDTLAVKNPQLQDLAIIQNWRKNALAWTGVYFLGLGTMVFVAGAVLSVCCDAWLR